MIGILNKETTKMDIDPTKTDAPKTDAPADDKKDAEVKPGDENPQNFIDVEALAKIIKANELDDEVRAILAQKVQRRHNVIKRSFYSKTHSWKLFEAEGKNTQSEHIEDLVSQQWLRWCSKSF